MSAGTGQAGGYDSWVSQRPRYIRKFQSRRACWFGKSTASGSTATNDDPFEAKPGDRRSSHKGQPVDLRLPLGPDFTGSRAEAVKDEFAYLMRIGAPPRWISAAHRF